MAKDSKMKAKWADPAYRARQTARIRAAAEKRWTPEERERVSKLTSQRNREMFARKKAVLG